jgi:type I restriction enzyme, S subunit
MRRMTSPNHWRKMPLIEVAMLQRGFDLPVSKRLPGEVPVFAANGPVGTHNVVKVEGPGVVTGRSGTIGSVHYVDRGYWPLNTSLFVKDFHGNHPRFIYYLLKWLRLERFHEGTGVPTLNRNNIHGIIVDVPPLIEQRRIAAILDKADAIRHKHQRAIERIEDFLRSVFLDMFGDPATNPKGWKVGVLGDVVSAAQDGPHVSPQYADDGRSRVFIIMGDAEAIAPRGVAGACGVDQTRWPASHEPARPHDRWYGWHVLCSDLR